MKKILTKKAVVFGLAIALAVFISARILSEYGPVSAEASDRYKKYQESFKSSDESGWNKIDTANESLLKMEKGRFVFQMDLKTTRFTVTDSVSGAIYESFPETTPGLMSEEDIARASSNISLSYYNSASQLLYMGSGRDSVAQGQFEIYRKEDKLRILYTIGKDISDLFAPIAVTRQDMDEIVFEGLKASENARLKSYYKLYSDDNKPADYDDVMNKYPALKGKSVYILRETTEQGMLEISKLFKKSGYSQKQAQENIDRLGISGGEQELPAGFFIILELAMSDKGISAEILTDRIEENNSTDKLYDVYLLEYFGAKGAGAKGYMLVPDGSGAKIEMNQKQAVNYLQHFYNDDLLINTAEEKQLSRNVPIPYFGMACDTGSFIAYAGGGAGAGLVSARTMGGSNPMNMVSARFRVRSVDKTDIGKDRNIPTLNVYNAHILYEHPKVNYTLLPFGGELLRQMALAVRGEAGLETGASDKNQVPLYLDFLCLSFSETDVLGSTQYIPVVLSTLSDIKEIVRELHDAGIGNLKIRLKGWTEQGLSHSAFHSAALSKKVGTLKELEALDTLLKSKGGQLFLDTGFTFAQRNKAFDSLVISRDGARNLEGSIASLREFDRVTLQKIPKFREGFIISPFSYMTFADEFLNGYGKALKNYALSWSTGGSYLTADYNKDSDIDMPYAARAAADVFEKLEKASSQKLMTDYGYNYALPFVSDIANLPMTSSYFTAQTETVGFLQMILSGKRDYSGPALNLTGSRWKLPQMAASGSAPYYLLITKDNQNIKETGLQDTYYSLYYKAHLQEIKASYHSYSQVMDRLYGLEIVSYEELYPNVTKTVFSEGTELFANASSKTVRIGGIELEPFSYQAGKPDS